MRIIPIDLNNPQSYYGTIQQGENLATRLEITLSAVFQGYKYALSLQNNNADMVITEELFATENVITYVIPGIVTSEAGDLKLALQAYEQLDENNRRVLKTATMKLSVAVSLVSEEMPDGFLPWYVKASEQAGISTEQAILATEQADRAFNQAVISAEQAVMSKTSADEALVSENNAKTSEDNALISEGKALISEDNAKTSENNAKTSETNSLLSEINAKDSETNAKTSELNAKNSEDNAKTSEINSKESETNAKLSENVVLQKLNEVVIENLQLADNIILGGQVLEDLESNILVGNNVNLVLEENVRDAHAINSELLEPEIGTIKQANSINLELRTNIDLADDKNSALEQSIVDSVVVKNNLDGSLNAGTTLKGELVNKITIGNTTKINLDSSTSTAVTTKTALDECILVGNALKTNLDNSIATGQTTKQELETAITNGKIGNLTELTTQDKSSLVKAINENVSELSNLATREFKIKNLITNGDFSNGTTGWSEAGTSPQISVADNTVSISSAASSAVGIIQDAVFPENHIIYVASNVRNISVGADVRFRINRYGSTTTILDLINNSTEFKRQSANIIIPAGVNGIRVYLRVNGTAEFKNILSIDLTTIFGTGNEPTDKEMDVLIDLLGGWFNGEITVSQKILANWYLKMIRQNRNAIVALGGTII